MYQRSLQCSLALLCVFTTALLSGASPGGAASGQHSALLTPDSTIWTVGNNDQNELGDGLGQDRLIRAAVMSGASAVATQ
jgi:hypothetical protein